MTGKPEVNFRLADDRCTEGSCPLDRMSMGRNTLSSIFMRMLLIGASGFIGPHVVRGLVDRGHEVAVFHRRKAAVSFPSDVRTIAGDRNRLSEYSTALREFEPEVVIDGGVVMGN